LETLVLGPEVIAISIVVGRQQQMLAVQTGKIVNGVLGQVQVGAKKSTVGHMILFTDITNQIA
jgi:hypothetical protein